MTITYEWIIKFSYDTFTIEPDRCILPPMKGPCLGNIRRYYYNTETQKCDQFRYGGCQGNENNFFSLHKCEQSCSG